MAIYSTGKPQAAHFTRDKLCIPVSKLAMLVSIAKREPVCSLSTFYKENKMSKNSYADASFKQKFCESYSEEPSEPNTE